LKWRFIGGRELIHVNRTMRGWNSLSLWSNSFEEASMNNGRHFLLSAFLGLGVSIVAPLTMAQALLGYPTPLGWAGSGATIFSSGIPVVSDTSSVAGATTSISHVEDPIVSGWGNYSPYVLRGGIRADAGAQQIWGRVDTSATNSTSPRRTASQPNWHSVFRS